MSDNKGFLLSLDAVEGIGIDGAQWLNSVGIQLEKAETIEEKRGNSAATIKHLGRTSPEEISFKAAGVMANLPLMQWAQLALRGQNIPQTGSVQARTEFKNNSTERLPDVYNFEGALLTSMTLPSVGTDDGNSIGMIDIKVQPSAIRVEKLNKRASMDRPERGFRDVIMPNDYMFLIDDIPESAQATKIEGLNIRFKTKKVQYGDPKQGIDVVPAGIEISDLTFEIPMIYCDRLLKYYESKATDRVKVNTLGTGELVYMNRSRELTLSAVSYSGLAIKEVSVDEASASNSKGPNMKVTMSVGNVAINSRAKNH